MNNNNWQRNFFTIWTGQAISLITSAVLQMAIIWYLTDTTGSAAVLSIAAIVGFLPQALFGSFIGVLVDRWNRKFVMIGADLIIAAAGGLLAFLVLTMELPVWLVMVILFVRSVGTAFHTPALGAITPLLVPEEQLTKCAGYTQSLQSVSFILSPAIAAFMYAAWDLTAVIYLDIVGAIIASITVVFIMIPKHERVVSATTSVLGEMKAGYAILKSHQALFALLWIGAMYSFIYMPINALFPLMSMEYFGGTTKHAAIVEILFAVGMLSGGVVLGVTGGFKNRAMSIVASLFLMGAALTISGLLSVNGFIAFAVMCMLMGVSAPFFNGVFTALIQEKIAPEYLGRVFGLLGSLFSLAMPGGLILSALFADRLGVHNWFTISGVAVLLLSVFCAMIPAIRKLEQSR
ncbi:MFS transporter [Sporosarcina sp. FSL K6-1522]|uniref:MFS transporter n=1 Tax=Sporosarcina sp. FSL K6-1522 TaxID=2921554 RepID=UPI00315A66B8